MDDKEKKPKLQENEEFSTEINLNNLSAENITATAIGQNPNIVVENTQVQHEANIFSINNMVTPQLLEQFAKLLQSYGENKQNNENSSSSPHSFSGLSANIFAVNSNVTLGLKEEEHYLPQVRDFLDTLHHAPIK